jgi:two-component system, sensor histidine kinase and response regulator
MSGDINILVVDDVPQNLVAVEALLGRPGLNTILAASGAEALEVLLVKEVALVLIDVQMPQMDGFELAALIRGSARTSNIPLIFLTAGAREPKNSFRGYEAGAVDFLYKPIDEVVLKSKVNVFVELYAKEKQLAKQLEELKQALALNEIFAAVLGHDLRTPLSAVLNGTDLLLKISQDPMIRMAATRMQSSTLRMSKMVEQLLDVARIRAGNLQLCGRDTDYAEQCRQLADELGDHRKSGRITIEAIGNTSGFADVDRIQQVFSNLMNNALQHGDKAAPVIVIVDGTDPQWISVSVQNAGAIPAEALESIFEPFVSRQKIQKTTQGLGLGLYIVRKFVELHGGNVSITSSEDSGTRFVTRFPRLHCV